MHRLDRGHEVECAYESPRKGRCEQYENHDGPQLRAGERCTYVSPDGTRCGCNSAPHGLHEVTRSNRRYRHSK